MVITMVTTTSSPRMVKSRERNTFFQTDFLVFSSLPSGGGLLLLIARENEFLVVLFLRFAGCDVEAWLPYFIFHPDLAFVTH